MSLTFVILFFSAIALAAYLIPKKKKTEYYAEVNCENCDKKHDIKVPIGKTVDSVINNLKCTSCGVVGEMINITKNFEDYEY